MNDEGAETETQRRKRRGSSKDWYQAEAKSRPSCSALRLECRKLRGSIDLIENNARHIKWRR